MRSDHPAAAAESTVHCSLHSASDGDEPTTEELIQLLKRALREADNRQTRPAREVKRELRAMTETDAVGS